MPQGLENIYKIVDEPYVLYQKVKLHTKGTLIKFLFGFCIIYAILNWTPEILGNIFTTSYIDVISQITSIDEAVREQLPATPVIIYIFAFLFNGVFALGEALYTLTYIRNRKTEYSALFEGFSFYFKALGLYVVKTVIVFMMSMLFVIPGVIAALAYSQCFYILADNPDKGVFQILAESKLRMFGNKMTFFKYFLLYVPFIVVAYMPSTILVWFTDVNTSSLIGTLLLLVLEIPMYFALGYFEVGKAGFYELLKNEGFENFKYSGQDAFRKQNIVV